MAVRIPVDAVPLIALFPDQAPVAVQDVALVADHVTVELLPLDTALGPTLKVTVGVAALTVTVVD